MLEKKIKCPTCNNILTVNGNPGDTIIITCPNCDTKGKFSFKETGISSKETSIVPALEIYNVTKTFNGFKAVDNVSFSVRKGEIFGFLGPNGAGKTTTIKAILGLLHADSGRIRINGFDIKEDEIEAKRSIGYLPERVSFYDNLNPLQTLHFFCELQGVDKSVAMDLLKEVGLSDVIDRKVGGFSKGMQQLLGIAQTMIGDIPVYIFDEPMSGLDPRWVKIVRDMIIKLNERGATIMFSSHILSEVQNLCDRVVIINKGKIIAQDSVENLNRYLNIKPRIEILIPGLHGKIPGSIRKIKGILSLDIKEDKLIITCESTFRMNIITEIKNQGFDVKDIQTFEPTLEEAFIKIISRSEEMG
ncbi:MAG: ABC transporter ATP-binding protein [Thermoplasmatales archaeon]|nr:MAG: ABC transporter ATP-binding protein [Thermoplasmatales archaeon]